MCFGLELADLQLEATRPVEAAMKKEQVEGEVRPPTWERHLAADEAEVRGPDSIRNRLQIREQAVVVVELDDGQMKSSGLLSE